VRCDASRKLYGRFTLVPQSGSSRPPRASRFPASGIRGDRQKQAVASSEVAASGYNNDKEAYYYDKEAYYDDNDKEAYYYYYDKEADYDHP